MTNAQFIPVIFPNYSVGESGVNHALPGLGHAGFILVNSSGNATYYEYGLYNSQSVGVVTNNANGNVRELNLGVLQFDNLGNVTQASLKNALDILTGSSQFYKDDTGVIFASAFNIQSGTQYNQIQNAVNNLITNDNLPSAPSYTVWNNNCLGFVYSMANAGGLTISSNQNGVGPNLPAQAPYNILNNNGTGYEYYGPNSWNSNQINQVTSFDNIAESTDWAINIGNAVINDFAILGSPIFNSIGSVSTWIGGKLTTLSNGNVQTTYSSSNGAKIIETFGQSDTPISLDFTKNNLLIGQVGFNIDGSNTLSKYNLSGSHTETATNFSNGSSQIELFDPTSTISTEFQNFTGANGGGQMTQDMVDYFNGTSSLTESAYSAPGVLNGFVSINNFSTGAFSTDSAGDTILALDGFGDKLIVSPSTQAFIDNAQGQQIASYTSGVLGYVGKDASGEAVIGTVQLSVYSGQLLNLSLLNTDGTLTADGISFNSSDNLYTSSFSQLTSNPYSLQTAANNAIGLDAADVDQALVNYASNDNYPMGLRKRA